MLTPGRKSRRSILTPSRSNSRVASPAPAAEKPRIISETSQYKLETIPWSVHSVARESLKKRRASLSGLSGSLGYVAEGNRVVVWMVAGNKMFELALPSTVSAVHLTEGGGAVVRTVKGEIVRWARVDQPQRYHSLKGVEGALDSTLHAGDLLILDSAHSVWVCGKAAATPLNPHSTLGGISRRVSSMFWAAPESQLGEAFRIVSAGEVVFVVGSKGIQRIHENVVTWTTDLGSLTSAADVCILDAIHHEGSLRCLVEAEGELRIISLSSKHTLLPTTVDSSLTIEVDAGSALCFLQEMAVLYEGPESEACTLVNLKNGVCVPVSLGDDVCGVFGAAGHFTLLSRSSGVVKLVVKDVKTAVQVAPDETVESRFYGAFKCFLDFGESDEQSTLQEILGTAEEPLINQIITDYGEYLVSATPAADPRWAGGSDTTLPVTPELQIAERIKRLQGLLQFIVTTRYFDCYLASVTQLLVHVEKCILAQALCGSKSEVLSTAITQAAAAFPNENGLSPREVLFSNISRIEVVFASIATAQSALVSSDAPSESTIHELFLSVEIVQRAFDALYAWREQSSQLYQRAASKEAVWSDSDEIRRLLNGQITIAMQTVLPEVDAEGRFQVLPVATNLVISLLKLYQDALAKTNEKDALQAEFERKRDALIQPFVDLKLHNIAFALAEQFRHFSLLVALCEETKDTARLRDLSTAYPEFAEVAYNWYLAHGKESRLLTAGVAPTERLSQFLSSQPNLKWIHQLGNKDYSTAADTLARLGTQEKALLSRKKTLLSLSKLSALASDSQTPDLTPIDLQLEVITHQERLKPEIAENAGLSDTAMPPLSCPDLIRLCVSPECNPSLEEVDVKKALDLLTCAARDGDVTDTQFERLRLAIWRAVIEGDSWWEKSAGPETIDETLFYRAVILAYNSGLVISHILPGVDDLIGELDDKQKEFVLRSGYEQMAQMGLITA